MPLPTQNKPAKIWYFRQGLAGFAKSFKDKSTRLSARRIARFSALDTAIVAIAVKTSIWTVVSSVTLLGGLAAGALVLGTAYMTVKIFQDAAAIKRSSFFKDFMRKRLQQRMLKGSLLTQAKRGMKRTWNNILRAVSVTAAAAGTALAAVTGLNLAGVGAVAGFAPAAAVLKGVAIAGTAFGLGAAAIPVALGLGVAAITAGVFSTIGCTRRIRALQTPQAAPKKTFTPVDQSTPRALESSAAESFAPAAAPAPSARPDDVEDREAARLARKNRNSRTR